ncbi:MAG: CvpA family protein [Candidatus Marinimicrobia bacterium]|nr:CvpA family protein [Candidatus Neomarinimicrobiota bacterium]
MHWFDVVIFALIVWFAIKGIMNGMVLGLFRLMGLVLGTLLAARYGAGLGSWFVHQFSAPPQVGQFIGYAAVFITIIIISQILAGMVKSLLEFVLLGWLDKAGGIAFGAVKALLISFVVFFAMSFLPENSITDGIYKDSRFYAFYEQNSPGLYARLVEPVLKKRNMPRSFRSTGTKRSKKPDIFGTDLFKTLLDNADKFSDKEIDYMIERFNTIDIDKQKQIIDELKKKNWNIYDLLPETRE